MEWSKQGNILLVGNNPFTLSTSEVRAFRPTCHKKQIKRRRLIIENKQAWNNITRFLISQILRCSEARWPNIKEGLAVFTFNTLFAKPIEGSVDGKIGKSVYGVVATDIRLLCVGSCTKKIVWGHFLADEALLFADLHVIWWKRVPRKRETGNVVRGISTISSHV